MHQWGSGKLGILLDPRLRFITYLTFNNYLCYQFFVRLICGEDPCRPPLLCGALRGLVFAATILTLISLLTCWSMD